MLPDPDTYATAPRTGPEHERTDEPDRLPDARATRFSGIDRTELRRVLAAGVDHGGNPIEAFEDETGGWPLRCCLSDSRAGERIAIIAWSPFPWSGPYREVGPIVVPTPDRVDLSHLPDSLDRAPMVVRPYDHQHRIAYAKVRHVPAGGSLTAVVRELLDDETIDFVHGRNVTGGCFSFEARAHPSDEGRTG